MCRSRFRRRMVRLPSQSSARHCSWDRSLTPTGVVSMNRLRFATARAALLLAIFAASGAHRLHAQELPSKLSDAEFWKLVTDFSEPGGFGQLRLQRDDVSVGHTRAPADDETGRRLPRRRARSELHVYRRAQAEDLFHLRHSSAEHADALDVQVAVRAVRRPRRFSFTLVLASARRSSTRRPQRTRSFSPTAWFRPTARRTRRISRRSTIGCVTMASR